MIFQPRNGSLFVCLSSLLLISSCSTPSGITEQTKNFDAPTNWHQQTPIQSAIDAPSWLAEFNDPVLVSLTEKALNNNRSLKASKNDIDIANLQRTESDASDWPDISLSLSNSRVKSVSDDTASYDNSAQLSLDATYELDIWGKLSAEQQRANLTYLAAKASYQYERDALTATITKAWFNLSEAQQLYRLYEEQAKNLKNNVDIINGSYQLGLNDALDVYLAQNSLKSEQAKLALQGQQVLVAKREIELLIGEYPKGLVKNDMKLPLMSAPITTALPSTMLQNRNDLNASWYQLLALDASLAIAHKQRFPSIALTASTGDSSEQLDDLLSGSSLAWSLIGNITMPIFNASRLESIEEQARLNVVKQESLYLDEMFNAFADVENAISNHSALLKQYQFLLLAKENAQAADNLSFSQYLKGLVSYTTVLESQRRAFDAQTSIIQSKNQLLQNRVDLHLAVGGDFNNDIIATQSNNNSASN